MPSFLKRVFSSSTASTKDILDGRSPFPLPHPSRLLSSRYLNVCMTTSNACSTEATKKKVITSRCGDRVRLLFMSIGTPYSLQSCFCTAVNVRSDMVFLRNNPMCQRHHTGCVILGYGPCQESRNDIFWRLVIPM